MKTKFERMMSLYGREEEYYNRLNEEIKEYVKRNKRP